MVNRRINIGIALLMLFSVLGTAYAADNSNIVDNAVFPLQPGFQRLSDVSFFNQGTEQTKICYKIVMIRILPFRLVLGI
jgi:hypothetical protein